MFWIFLITLIGAVLLMQLGAYSMLVSVLSMALKIVLMVAGLLIGLLLLRKVFFRS